MECPDAGDGRSAERATLEQVQDRLKTHKPSDRKAAPEADAVSALDELGTHTENHDDDDNERSRARVLRLMGIISYDGDTDFSCVLGLSSRVSCPCC